MRFSLRLTLSLAIVVAIATLVSLPLLDRVTSQWFVRDLDIRSRLISEVLDGEMSALPPGEAKDSAKRAAALRARLQVFSDRVARDERVYAIAICATDGSVIAATSAFAPPLTCAGAGSGPQSSVFALGKRFLHAYYSVVAVGGDRAVVTVYHDMAFIAKRSTEAKRAVLGTFLVLLLVLTSLSLFIAHWSLRVWMQGVRDLIRLPRISRSRLARVLPDLQPIARDLRNWAREMSQSGELRDPAQVSWSPETLRSVLHKELAGEEVFVVSNREPYIHSRDAAGDIHVQVPASGLVTALEPIMRACAGTWIAHGSGSADREVVDAHDRVAVPPEDPAYSLKRVWLSEEDEKGYYYGFANEGLWPLCHIAHTRPVFRSDDFEKYRKVNALFADAVVREAKTRNPVILVQDYHFALLPRMIREKLPDATIITFWHIPWPNSEAFGICPWREELLDGLLGSSIMGFHTRFHCHNFLDSIDRYLESRIERETMTVSYGGEKTQVAAYPISIEWPPRKLKQVAPVEVARVRVRERHRLPTATRLAIGVDRLDYTKGILERFNGVERLLELRPEYRGKFTLVQIGAPTRSNIPQYRQFAEFVTEEAQRINARFPAEGEGGAPAILLLDQHHDPEKVFEYFRASDVCLVTSLHDGMNLVAKEFIGCRDDEDGVLILSQFAGASKELPESIVINPYDVDQCAEALHVALSMPADQRRLRMRSMRAFVQEFNVYRWAGRMLLDATKARKLARLRRPRKFGRGEKGAFP